MTDTSRWTILYPIFINQNRTIAQGRKISIENSLDKPKLKELQKASEELGFPSQEQVQTLTLLTISQTIIIRSNPQKKQGDSGFNYGTMTDHLFGKILHHVWDGEIWGNE